MTWWKRKTKQPFQRNYLYLPKQFHVKHDICVDLLYQIEEVVIGQSYQSLRVKTIQMDNDGTIEFEDVLDYLLEKGRKGEHDEIIRNQVLIGLLGDICYFTQEAMTCSIKQRLTVCCALLRKPFVYTMIVMMRLLAEEGFIDRFNNEEKFDPASIAPEDRRTLIEAIINLMPHKPFTVEDIDEWIFDKTSPDSIINLSDAALHLTTTRNRHNATEKQNFNFIFSDSQDIQSQWELIYSRMPALILFLVQVTDIMLIALMDLPDDLYQQRLVKRAAIVKRYSDDMTKD